MNSMLVYLMSELTWSYVSDFVTKHAPRGMFWGYYGPIYNSLAVLAVFWLVAYWLYRQKAFLRI